MKKSFLFIALVFLFAACEKTADIEVPENPPMMAVFGFVEEGKMVVIKLEEVVPVFGKTKRDPVPVSGALVIVKEGTNTYVLPEWPGLNGTYVLQSFFGEAGKTYELEVSKSGFPDLKATCRVPDYLPDTVSYDYVAVPEPRGLLDSVRRIGFFWDDQPGNSNFYRFSAVVYMNNNQNHIDVQFVDQNKADDSKHGQQIYSGLGTFWHGSVGMTTTSLEAKFELIALDEHAFRYMRSFDAAYFNNDNPFAEPVIVYTNIQGGIGVFGGVNRKFFNTKIY